MQCVLLVASSDHWITVLWVVCNQSLNARPQTLFFSLALVSRIRVSAVLVLSTAVFQLAHWLDAEPLLSCVTMGMLAVNR